MSEVTRHEPEIDALTLARARRALDMAGVLDGALVVSHQTAVVAVAWGILHGMRLGAEELSGQRHCRVCGCTQLRTCDQDSPCCWVAKDLCSACRPFVGAG